MDKQEFNKERLTQYSPLSIEDFYSSNPFAAEIKRTGIEIKP